MIISLWDKEIRKLPIFKMFTIIILGKLEEEVVFKSRERMSGLNNEYSYGIANHYIY